MADWLRRATGMLRLYIATKLLGDLRPGVFVGRVVRNTGDVEWDWGELHEGQLTPINFSEVFRG